MKLEDLVQQKNDDFKIDFEADAATYLQEIQMNIDPHKFVPCDPAGKFSDDCVVMFDDGVLEEPPQVAKDQNDEVSAFAEENVNMEEALHD